MSLRAEGIEVRAAGKSLIADVSLDIAEGELVAVIGPNGAGKSTLMGALAGDRAVARGHVLLDGQPIGKWRNISLARRRAVLLQHSAVAFDFTALQVTVLGLLAHRGRLSDREIEAIAESALAETEASAYADRPYTVLSGGERQRVQLARVLAQCDANPASGFFLLLDEPIAGLDLAHQHAALASVRRRVDRGVGALAVLHDLNMASCYCDRVAILEEGRLATVAPTAEALEPQRLSQLFRTPIHRLEVEGGIAFHSTGTRR